MHFKNSNNLKYEVITEDSAGTSDAPAADT